MDNWDVAGYYHLEQVKDVDAAACDCESVPCIDNPGYSWLVDVYGAGEVKIDWAAFDGNPIAVLRSILTQLAEHGYSPAAQQVGWLDQMERTNMLMPYVDIVSEDGGGIRIVYVGKRPHWRLLTAD